jgi:hypothetical protein
MHRRAVETWFAFVGIGIANGVVHRATYGRYVSELRGHQISSVICALGLLAAAYALTRKVAVKERDRTLFAVGLVWAAATIAFEFLMGHYVNRDSWAALVQAYDIRAGRIWVLVPLTILLSPLIVKRLAAHTLVRTRPVHA